MPARPFGGARAEYPPLGRFVDAAGTRLHYLAQGSGRAVVLLHGNPGSLHHFLPVVDGLAGSFRAIAFDRPGHGYSEPARGEGGSPVVQARIVHAALEELDVSRPILVAESWSGSLALAYALEFPEEVAGIVTAAGTFRGDPGLIDPTYGLFLTPVAGPIVRWTVAPLLARKRVRARLARAFSPQPVDPAFARRSIRLFTRPQSLLAVARDAVTRARLVPELAARYPEVTAPLVMLVGAEDSYVNQAEQAYRLRAELLDAELVEVPGTGHFVLECHPELVVEAVERLASRTA
jgi:pimeloyl-ACP methyl ester carboxylesterase